MNTNAHTYCVDRRQPPKQAVIIIIFDYTVSTFLSGGHSPVPRPLTISLQSQINFHRACKLPVLLLEAVQLLGDVGDGLARSLAQKKKLVSAVGCAAAEAAHTRTNISIHESRQII